MPQFSSTPVTYTGVGYNTFLASAMPSVVNVKNNKGGASTAATVYLCTTREEIYRALQIDADIAVSNSWGSFSDRLHFIDSLEINTTTVTIIVSAMLTNSSSVVADVSFSKDFSSALELFKQGGDSFVSYTAMGGQYMAAYTFVAYDISTYQQVKNIASTNFSVAGSDFEASFATEITNIQSQSGIAARFHQAGIGFSSTKLPSAEQLVGFVLNFGTIDLDGPAVMSFSTLSYSAVQGCPKFSNIDHLRSQYISPTGSTQRIADWEELAINNKNVINTVATIYDNYGFLSIDPKFVSVPAALQGVIDAIGGWREAVNDDPTDPDITPPVIDPALFALPTAMYTFDIGVGIGSNGGSAFQDVSIDMIWKGVRITSITIWGNKVVDRIVTTYAQDDVGQPTFVGDHGGGGGYSTPTIHIGLGEWITKSEAWADKFVSRVGIQTTTQPMIDHPDNDNGSSYVTWTPPTATSVFVGWSGKSGDVVDQLEPMFANFSAPTWKSPRVKLAHSSHGSKMQLTGRGHCDPL